MVELNFEYTTKELKKYSIFYEDSIVKNKIKVTNSNITLILVEKNIMLQKKRFIFYLLEQVFLFTAGTRPGTVFDDRPSYQKRKKIFLNNIDQKQNTTIYFYKDHIKYLSKDIKIEDLPPIYNEIIHKRLKNYSKYAPRFTIVFLSSILFIIFIIIIIGYFSSR